MAFEELVNGDSVTTLSADIDGSQTSITVASSVGFPSPNFRVRIGDELLIVTNVSGTTWTVTRGAEGTPGTSHVLGTTVNFCLTADALDTIRSEMVGTGAWTDLPSSGKKGMMYMPSDAPYILRHNGVNWDTYGPVFPARKINIADYTLLESSVGVTTVNSDDGGLHVGLASGLNSMMYYRSLGSYVGVVYCMMMEARVAQYCGHGVAFRNSSTGKFATGSFFYRDSVPGFSFDMLNWDDVNTSPSNYYPTVGSLPKCQNLHARRLYIRVSLSSGNNMNMEVSVDYINWMQVAFNFITTFTGAIDQIGFHIHNNTSYPISGTLVHWDLF